MGGDELCREERVPLTTSEDLIDEAKAGPPDQRLDLGGDLIAAESSEVHTVRRRQAGDLAQTATLLGIGSDLVGTVGADQHHTCSSTRLRARKIEQVPRQRIGPVQILERDDDHAVGTEPTSSSSGCEQRLGRQAPARRAGEPSRNGASGAR